MLPLTRRVSEEYLFSSSSFFRSEARSVGRRFVRSHSSSSLCLAAAASSSEQICKCQQPFIIRLRTICTGMLTASSCS